MNQEKIKKIIEKNDIKWVQVHFTDLLGRLRILHFSSNEFLNFVLEKGFNFDGSSVGLTGVEESDLIAIPDKKTFLILPHEKDEARIIANIYDTSLKPFPADPRYILNKAVGKAKRQGYDEIKISPEMEFYVLSEYRGNYEIEEKSGYFAPPPVDDAKDYRRELAETLIESGYSVKYHHHETGKYQHEVEIKTLNAIEAADFCIYFKYLAREIASLYNSLVTFMPKPFSNDAGNGMHAHIVLYSRGKNVFYDENDKYNMSQTARYFIGGIIEHARGMAAIANPTVNSYKRLIPNFEAPCYITWARYNRSSLIRIPAKKEIDIEIRNADPTANPYLFYAVIIYAGLDGIKKKIEYEAVEKNLYKLSEKEIREYGIKKMPSNLMEAIEELENDNVIKKAIGKEAVEMFIEEKKKEWRRYMTEITDLDYKFYFHY
jgi:glutamine synthetase